MSFRFSLLGLVSLLSFAGLACAALVRPGPEWLGIVVTLTALMIGYQSLRAMLVSGSPRAAAVGWLVFAISYLSLTIGPWLGDQLGPNLLSSKGLAYAQVQWRKESADTFANEYARRINLNQLITPTIYNGSSGALMWTDIDVNGWVYRATGDTWWNAAPVNCFRASGHWLIAWLAGWLGAAIAVVLQQRAARKTAG